MGHGRSQIPAAIGCHQYYPLKTQCNLLMESGPFDGPDIDINAPMQCLSRLTPLSTGPGYGGKGHFWRYFCAKSPEFET